MDEKRVPWGWMKAGEAAAYLRVSLATLNELNEVIRPARTPGGHRRYSVRMLNRYLRNSRRQRG